MTEFPGLLLAGLLVDRIGRKVSMGGLILLCCAFLAPLAIHLEEGLAITLLFCARACSAGSFAVIHAYSPEVITDMLLIYIFCFRFDTFLKLDYDRSHQY
jgi:MFS family permease